MIWSAGDLGIEIDFGLLYKEPGAVLQRKGKDGYSDYLVDGKPVMNPFDVEMLVSEWRDPALKVRKGLGFFGIMI